MAGSDPRGPDGPDAGRPRQPRIDDFLVEPTRRLADWRWLWDIDQPFPIRSHRGGLGGLLVAVKRLFRPLVKVPQNDLWERQRTFNLILLEHLQHLYDFRDAFPREVRAVDADHESRLAFLEGLSARGLNEVMRHNDALFARVDQKLDRYRRTARELLGSLGAALAAVADGAPAASTLARARDDFGYVELEADFRGTEAEVGERIAPYLSYLEGRGEVLDLGCGRGEALALLAARGIPARGVDRNARMVARCREQGLAAVEGDLLEALAAEPEGSLGGIVSFHVVEHLPVAAVDQLVRLAWRALAPRGVLILETPNPLSLVVAARNFWLDPTHQRPLHPATLKLLYELAGFDPVERLDLRPFPPAERLPEIDLAALPTEQAELADQVNRLRDRLDDLLFGFQDYGMVGIKGGR